MADEIETDGPETNAEGGPGRRRRRRRRRRRGGGAAEGGDNGGPGFPEDVLLVADGGGPPHAQGGQRRSRRQVEVNQGPSVSLPSSGRNPYRKRSTRTRRSTPGAAAARRRRLSRGEVDSLLHWLESMPEPLVAVLYRGLGGQPDRVASTDRMIQLTVRALGQGARLGSLLKTLNERDRKALASLLQCGGVAHADEFHRELQLSYGGHEREWQRVMVNLGSKGLVFASPEVDGQFFYLVPEPLVDGLLAELGDDLGLPTFSHPEVRVMDAKPFCPPLHFSVTTLATYIDQYSPRLTQRHDIYRHDQEAMDQFFAQIWEPESELFSFHLQFLMMHNMVELRGEYLALNRDVLEEWLQLEAEDQRDLLFAALDKRFSNAEWVLWAIHGATAASWRGLDGEPGGDWVAERPLVALYRRWKRGEDWRDRFQRNQYANVRGNERESYSFSPLVRAGILEMGQWGQEKFYRLSPRGRQMLEPAGDDGFQQFYLTPSFEIMAPAGLAPILLFRIGELADLIGCDRANTYKVTETSVERALGRGWRRDDVLQFLRDNSQIGLPDNVEGTLKGWIGHRGDVEFHEVTLLTVHRSQIRRLEGHKKVKPYILHRFAPGMYAVDRHRLPEIIAVLQDTGFSPAQDVRRYPGDPEQVEARNALHKLVAEAREAAVEPAQRGSDLVKPGELHVVPGSKLAKGPDDLPEPAEPDLPPEVSVADVRRLIDLALSEDRDLEMVYVAKTGHRLALLVQPQRIAFKAEAPVLVGLDRAENEPRTFVLDKIERLRVVAPGAGNG